MDLYTFDANFQRDQVVEKYSSLIWTERYSDSGECVLDYPQNSTTAELIREGVFLGIEGSPEIVIIDTLSIKEGVITASGKTLVEFLKQRIFRTTWQTVFDSWDAPTSSAAAICSIIIRDMCTPGGIMASGDVTPSDGIDEVVPGLNAFGLSAVGDPIQVSIPFGNVYDAIKSLCNLDNIGFRIVPDDITSSAGILNFDTYRGLDRTSDQDVNELVIFEPALDSLAEIEELRSTTDWKNVAYAWAANMPDQASIGYAVVPGPTPTGFDRRTLMVDASDIDATGYLDADLKAILDQRAANALVNNNYIRTTDGKIISHGPFLYGDAFSLGDIVELRNENSFAQKARITEYIRAEDNTGESAYPTLSIVD